MSRFPTAGHLLSWAGLCPRNDESAGKRRLPYGGVPTFLDLPFKESFADLDIALIGVPMDLGVTNRPGARFGPRALRTIERIGPYHHALNSAPIANRRIADIGVALRG